MNGQQGAESLEPDKIKRIREQSHMSQGTFALALNVRHDTRRQMGARRRAPERTSLKLLALARTKGIDAIL
jgi:putative transcriptional regulator